MGNRAVRMSSHEEVQKRRTFEPVDTFKFHKSFEVKSNNGLYFNDVYIPEELVVMILSFIDPKEILKASLVCKKWCNIIKSESLWTSIYTREYNKKPKRLPWYVYYCLFSTTYFDNNLIKNGNGQKKYKHWKIIMNYGDAFRIEDPPVGSKPLPPDIPEFSGKTSCFATSYYECNKLQEISLENNRLLQLILDKYKPHIYLSEWVTARFDCGCVYDLWCKLYGKKSSGGLSKIGRLSCYDNSRSSSSDAEFYDGNSSDEDQEEPLYFERTGTSMDQWAASSWTKIEMLIKDYPNGVKRIVFQHEGKDTQFWKGHYGSKMAGGVVKILFDTIEAST